MRISIKYLISTLLLSTVVSEAVVVVSFKQEGTNVRAEWSGTLSLDPLLATDTSLSGGAYADAGSNFLLNKASASLGNAGYYNRLGDYTITSLSGSPLLRQVPSFGYAGKELYWADVHVSGGSVGSVSELTFDPTRDYFLFPNTDLASIGANSFDNTVAWTATTTGDTIIYKTIFSLQMETTGAFIVLEWTPLGSSYFYQLETKTKLTDHAWSLAEPTNQWPIAEHSWTHSFIPSETNRFFRVVGWEK